MAGLSAERLAEVKDRLLDRKKRLWLEVKDQLKSSIGDGYQEMLSTARDEEDQATVSLMESRACPRPAGRARTPVPPSPEQAGYATSHVGTATISKPCSIRPYSIPLAFLFS